MPFPEQYKKYQEKSVNGLTAGELIVLLYEQAIMNLNKAVVMMENHNICETHNSIVKAENIFVYLNESLDMSFPISKDLSSLYKYIYNLLIEANIKKDASLIKSAIKIASDLKDSWKEAEIISRSKAKSS